MAKVSKFLDTEKKHVGYGFYCPGCECYHMAWTQHPNGVGAQWSFNGSVDKPTFQPSILNTYPDGRVCHLYVREGKIEYLSDCFHDLAGQTIEMEEEE